MSFQEGSENFNGGAFSDPPSGGCGCDPATGGGPLLSFTANKWDSSKYKGWGLLGVIVDLLLIFFLMLTIIALVAIGIRGDSSDHTFMQVCGGSLFILVCIQIIGGHLSSAFNGMASTA
jgi:hypothetical protein